MATANTEGRDEILDPHRREEIRNATVELAGRLSTKGVRLMGNESSEELDDMLTAVEEFEDAVMARGGDLMNNSPLSTDPPDPQYVLPQRRENENPADYIKRVDQAAAQLDRGD